MQMSADSWPCQGSAHLARMSYPNIQTEKVWAIHTEMCNCRGNKSCFVNLWKGAPGFQRNCLAPSGVEKYQAWHCSVIYTYFCIHEFDYACHIWFLIFCWLGSSLLDLVDSEQITRINLESLHFRCVMTCPGLAPPTYQMVQEMVFEELHLPADVAAEAQDVNWS